MFDVNSFMTPTLRKRFVALKSISAQAVFLLELLDYTNYFKNEADEISIYCKENDNTVFSTEKFERMWNKRDFITRYAKRVRSTERVTKLINELCSDLLNKGENFDSIIEREKSVFNVVQSIDDFQVLDKTTNTKTDKALSATKKEKQEKKEDTAKKRSLSEILSYKELVEPPKPKKEKKKK